MHTNMVRIRKKRAAARIRLYKQLSRASDDQKEMFVVLAEWVKDFVDAIGYVEIIRIILEHLEEMTGDP